MEMTLNLTFEDGLKVAEAIRDTAIENGWEAEELDECGVIEEYARVVDAALTAMGIKISIDGTPSDEDEDAIEDDDWKEEVDDFGLPVDYWSEFDENKGDDENTEHDDSCRYSLTVKGEFALWYMEAGHTFEEACEIADLLFGEGE